MVLLTGQIESAELVSASNVYCKYFYVYGPDWQQVAGLEEGISQTCYRSQNSRSNEITLNTPLEGNFTSTNPFRWPQLVMSFYGQDLFGHDIIKGYAVTHLPTVPGRTKRSIPVFIPQTSTMIQKIIGFFTGRRAEFIDPRIIAESEDRYGFLQCIILLVC